MKSILMSIHPKWVRKIFNGEKTIEVRKTRPLIDMPFKVYVYCTKKRMTRVPSMYAYLHKNEPGACAEYGTIETWGKIGDVIVNPHLASRHVSFGMHGKVIGSFVCDRTTRYNCDKDYDEYFVAGYIGAYMPFKEMCLTNKNLIEYGKGDALYGWHITEPKLFDKPKELSEFGTVCNRYENDECDDCPYLQVYVNSYPCDDCVDTWCGVDNIKPLTRPPQSWCYVEELQ